MDNQASSSGRARMYRRRKQPKGIRLTSRDQKVLAALAEHRLLSGDQLRRLVFQVSASKVRRRLRALYDHGLVRRMPILALPRQGIPPFVYTLSRDGVALLSGLGEMASETGTNGVGVQYIHHRYLVNEFYVTLVEASRAAECAVRGWRHEEALKVSRSRGGLPQAERVEHPRLSEPTSFLPDAFFELDLGQDHSFAFFVEIDRATHPQRVWRKRAQLYAAYADTRAGLFKRRFGRETFRVLIVTTPDYRKRSRRDNILRSIQATIGTSDMFLATTFEQMTAVCVLNRVWHRADGGNGMCSLLDNTRVVVRGNGGQRVVVAGHSRPVSPSGV